MNENSGRKSSREKRIVIALVALGSIVTLAFDAVLIWQVVEQRSSLSYAKISGVITHSELVIEAEEDTGPYYIADIEYRYRVGDTEYEGDRYRYGPDTEGDKSAQELIAEYPAGKKVAIYYDKQDPSDAVLSVGLERTDLYPVMLAIAFNLAMVALWCGVIWRIRHASCDSQSPIPNPSSSPNRDVGGS